MSETPKRPRSDTNTSESAGRPAPKRAKPEQTSDIAKSFGQFYRLGNKGFYVAKDNSVRYYDNETGEDVKIADTRTKFKNGIGFSDHYKEIKSRIEKANSEPYRPNLTMSTEVKHNIKPDGTVEEIEGGTMTIKGGKRSLKETPVNPTHTPTDSSTVVPVLSFTPPEQLPSATEKSEAEREMEEKIASLEAELKRQADIPKYEGTEATGGKLPEKTIAGLPLGNVGEFADRIPTQYKTEEDGKIVQDTEAMEQRKAYEKAMKPVVPEPTGEILKLLKEINTRELLKASEKEKREALKAKMRKRFTVLDKDYFLKY